MTFTREQHSACKDVLGILKVLTEWIRFRIGDPQEAGAGAW